MTTIKIPIAKPIIGEEEKIAVREVLDSGILAQGPRVAKFEEAFARFCGTKYAIAVNNGTSALHCALYAMGIGPGDEVITTPFTFVATANAILMQGARPVFADVDRETGLLDPKAVQAKITSKTKAIIPVDLYGQIYDYEQMQRIAKSHDILLLEDAAQSVGASRNGKKSGACGDMATFSFYATKNLISGEGGMITTDNEKFAQRAQQFRHHGQSPHDRYLYHDLGYNYRMMDLQAAIAHAQLIKLDRFTAARVRNAALLTEGLTDNPTLSPVPTLKGNQHVYHQYTVRISKGISRDDVLKKLADAGIGAGVYYPRPLHLHPHFERFGYKVGDFPHAEALAQEVISLPVHPLVSDEDIKSILEVLRHL